MKQEIDLTEDHILSDQAKRYEENRISRLNRSHRIPWDAKGVRYDDSNSFSNLYFTFGDENIKTISYNDVMDWVSTYDYVSPYIIIDNERSNNFSIGINQTSSIRSPLQYSVSSKTSSLSKRYYYTVDDKVEWSNSKIEKSLSFDDTVANFYCGRKLEIKQKRQKELENKKMYIIGKHKQKIARCPKCGKRETALQYMKYHKCESNELSKYRNLISTSGTSDRKCRILCERKRKVHYHHKRVPWDNETVISSNLRDGKFTLTYQENGYRYSYKPYHENNVKTLYRKNHVLARRENPWQRELLSVNDSRRETDKLKIIARKYEWRENLIKLGIVKDQIIMTPKMI